MTSLTRGLHTFLKPALAVTIAFGIAFTMVSPALAGPFPFDSGSSGSSSSSEQSPSTPEPGGGDPETPRTVVWKTEKIEGTAKTGITTVFPAAFSGTDAIEDLTAVVTGDIAAHSAATISIADDEGGHANVVVAPPISGSPLTGNLQIFRDTTPVSDVLPIHIITTSFSSTEIPSEPSMPSLSRVVSHENTRLVSDEILLWIADSVENPDQRARELAAEHHAVFTGSVPDLRMYVLQVSATSVEHLIAIKEILDKETGVEFASLNSYVQQTQSIPGNGNEFHTVQDAPLNRIQAPSAWNHTKGSGVRVGVVDTDVVEDHEDLIANKGQTVNLGSTSASHGTHVSGIICATGDNNKGITGVAPKCTLDNYSVFIGVPDPDNPSKFKKDSCNNEIDHSTTALITGSMSRAAKKGDKVVNLSLGTTYEFDTCETSPGEHRPCSPEMIQSKNENDKSYRKAIRNNRNSLFVFAAGNENRDAACSNGTLGGPAEGNVLVVGSIASEKSDNQTLSKFSNFGDSVDVVAPGENITSLTDRCWFLNRLCKSGYTEKSGTSMAAPHVTGVAALAFSANPAATAAEAKRCIIQGAQNSHDTVKNSRPEDHRTSYPVLKADATVNCIKNTTTPPEENPNTFPPVTCTKVQTDPSAPFYSAQFRWKHIRPGLSYKITATSNLGIIKTGEITPHEEIKSGEYIEFIIDRNFLEASSYLRDWTLTIQSFSAEHNEPDLPALTSLPIFFHQQNFLSVACGTTGRI